MNIRKQRDMHPLVLKAVIGLSGIVCYLLAFNVVYAELNSQSPEEVNYVKVVEGFVEAQHNSQEICHRLARANNLTYDCDVVTQHEKTLDMDLCKTTNSIQYCETTLKLAYDVYNHEVAEYKNSTLSKIYKFFMGKERVKYTSKYEWVDKIKIDKIPDNVRNI
ncbi:hypothetical protein [Pseudomonas sp. HY7a-MNA-CIBAN-0227]|uniref:hypothetical protein n=1 Tax=Pseudomonas sp. HY7a-MNA-CIBAN-0227 TaxID=3140474 RepID=UPI00331C9C50